MTVAFSVSGTSVTFGQVTAAGTCPVSREIAAALTGPTAALEPLPEGEQ